MLASLAEPPIQQHGLVYEPKYDGIRALIDLTPAPTARSKARGSKPGEAHVAIYSRNGNEKSRQFPAIVAALREIARTLDAPILIDGEIVAVDGQGTPLGFQNIQGRIHLTSDPEIAKAEQDQPAILIAFDLLRDGDEDLRGLPMAARRLRLQERVKPKRAAAQWVRLSEIAADDGRAMLQRAKAERWEGLIVKEGHSPYHSGRRSPAWRKMKLLKQQEFVVGGWTAPRQTRSHFGSLLLGYYDDKKALHWAGSVGTGFDQDELDRVAALLAKRAVAKSPFADAFKTMEKAHWVKPDLVVEVRFTEWTSDSLLRQPVYLGTRDDKKAQDVRREDPVQPPKPARGMHGMYRRNHRVAVSDEPAPAVSKPEVKTRPRGKARASSRGGRAAVALETTEIAELVEVLTSLEKSRKDGELRLSNGDRLRVTNPAKLFWHALKITKGDVLRYYVAVSPYLLPAVDDRPMVMKRFPNGVDSHAFYQQRHPETPPPGVRREVLPEDFEPINEEGSRERLIGGSLTTLLYMAQLAAISQDPWFSRVSHLPYQDFSAIDLDPGDGAGFDKVLDVARWVKDALDQFGIPAVPKTSGASGLHIYVPLPPDTTYETGQLLCHVVAAHVSVAHPKVATIERMVKRRPRGTVYVDYLQNILGKTIATAYSLRASDYAGVSTPLTWKEVAKGIDPRDFNIRTAMDRFRDVGDLWSELRTMKPVDIRAVLRRLPK
jgi:bifunctional non-homologous end joining protein LigD